MTIFKNIFLEALIPEQPMSAIANMGSDEPESNDVGPENDFDATIPMTVEPTSVPAPINVDLMSNPVDEEEILTKVLEPFVGQTYAELGAIVGMLEAISVLFQTFHWKSNGNSFYGDHQMFQRIYEGVDEQIDPVAEKALGLGASNLISSDKISETMNIFLIHCSEKHSIVTDDDNENFASAKKGKMALELFITTVETMMLDLKDKGLLTKGLDNLLAGILDTNEGFVYLLKQRTSIGL